MRRKRKGEGRRGRIEENGEGLGKKRGRVNKEGRGLWRKGEK